MLLLKDQTVEVEAAIAPSLGNRAIRLAVHGQNFLYWPSAVPTGMNGIPFLAPWANRMAGGGFEANGHRYEFNASPQLRRDGNGLPIHGLLTASRLWEVAETGADDESAFATSVLPFSRHPELLSNWPFPHSYEMTYRLSKGVLEVHLAIFNEGDQAMPVSIGFHPYFELPGVSRDDAFAHVPARQRVLMDAQLVATGEFEPVTLPDRVSLRDHRFDDGFTDLIHDPDVNVRFSVEGGGKRIDVTFGPRYPVAVIYAPPGHNYICFEPMTAVTNGVNLAAAGKYPQLQWVQAGEVWRESFWVKASRSA